MGFEKGFDGISKFATADTMIDKYFVIASD
jgi:hypothetical protein